MRELRVGRTSRKRFELDPDLGPAGEVVVERPMAARRLATRLNERAAGGAPTAHAGEIVALGLLHEVGHALIEHVERTAQPTLFDDALRELDEMVGRKPVDDVLTRIATEFGEDPERAELLEALLLLDVTAANPATTPIQPLVDPGPVARAKAYETVTRAMDGILGGDGPADADGTGESLASMLRSPARNSPTSLAGQLRYARERW